MARNDHLTAVSCCHALVVGKEVLSSEIFSALDTNRGLVKLMSKVSRSNLQYTASNFRKLPILSNFRRAADFLSNFRRVADFLPIFCRIS